MGWETDYITWVQRSLNRVVDTAIAVNGKDSKKYRRAVKKFNRNFVIGTLDAPKDDVGVVTQDTIIRENETDYNYMTWVQIMLIILGYTNLAPTNGRKDVKTRNAVKSFQRSHGLKADGFIGFRTETAIVNDTNQPPPGDLKPKGGK